MGRPRGMRGNFASSPPAPTGWHRSIGLGDGDAGDDDPRSLSDGGWSPLSQGVQVAGQLAPGYRVRGANDAEHLGVGYPAALQQSPQGGQDPERLQRRGGSAA